jgi:hypothetical protein
VNPKVTVSEGHQISENVRNRLKEEVEDILDVTVHIDPEDDSEQKPTQGLPGREQMLKQLNKLWSSLDSFQSIERINLHYLEGKVDVELLLPMSVMRDKEHAQQIADGYSRQGKCQEGVGEVKVCFH